MFVKSLHDKNGCEHYWVHCDFGILYFNLPFKALYIELLLLSASDCHDDSYHNCNHNQDYNNSGTN